MQPIFVPANYNPKLFLNEEGSLLTLEIQNIYETEHGDIIPARPQSGSADRQLPVRRQILPHPPRPGGRGSALDSTLMDMNFQPRSNSIWFLEPEEAITFLLDAYPKLVEAYRVYGEKDLTRYKVRLTPPSVVATVETQEEDKWFNLEINVEYDDHFRAHRQDLEGLDPGQALRAVKGWLLHQPARVVARKARPQAHRPGPTTRESRPRSVSRISRPRFWTRSSKTSPKPPPTDSGTPCATRSTTFRRSRQVEKPKGLDATLRPYQLQGVSYLNFLREYHFGGILADEMGLGKTIQTLTFLQYMKEQGHKGPNLIIVPTSVLPNWEREAQKFVPDMTRLVIYGARRENLFKKIEDSELIITTYALAAPGPGRADEVRVQLHHFGRGPEHQEPQHHHRQKCAQDAGPLPPLPVGHAHREHAP
jgi:non-specific serine/threonine protein kinase